MVSKSDVMASLKKQRLVDDPESWMKLATLIACTSVKVKEGKSLDSAVYDCYKELNK